jgi:hypothetical protein
MSSYLLAGVGWPLGGLAGRASGYRTLDTVSKIIVQLSCTRRNSELGTTKKECRQMRFVIAVAIIAVTLILYRRPELVQTSYFADGSRVLSYRVGR